MERGEKAVGERMGDGRGWWGKKWKRRG